MEPLLAKPPVSVQPYLTSRKFHKKNRGQNGSTPSATTEEKKNVTFHKRGKKPIPWQRDKGRKRHEMMIKESRYESITIFPNILTSHRWTGCCSAAPVEIKAAIRFPNNLRRRQASMRCLSCVFDVRMLCHAALLHLADLVSKRFMQTMRSESYTKTSACMKLFVALAKKNTPKKRELSTLF